MTVVDQESMVLDRVTIVPWFAECIECYHAVFCLQTWPKLEGPLHEHFVTFPVDARMYQRPVTSLGTKQIKVRLQKTLRSRHNTNWIV